MGGGCQPRCLLQGLSNRKEAGAPLHLAGKLNLLSKERPQIFPGDEVNGWMGTWRERSSWPFTSRPLKWASRWLGCSRSLVGNPALSGSVLLKAQ